MRNSFSQSSSETERTLSLDTVSRAVVIGPAAILGGGERKPPENRLVPEGERAAELERFDTAVIKATIQYGDRHKHVDLLPPELRQRMLEMLSAEISITGDPGLRKIVAAKTQAGESAAYALHAHFSDYVAMLRASDFTRRFAEPVESVMKELMHGLDQQDKGLTITEAPDGSIPVISAMPVGMMSNFLNQDGHVRINGMVNSSGTSKDHTNIIANSSGIAVGRLSPEELARLKTGDMIVIDGPGSKIVVNPSADTLARYEAALNANKDRDRTLLGRILEEQGPPRTRDGETVSVMGNIAFSTDVPMVNAMHADGIGLYRTEMAVAVYEHPPTVKFWELVFKHVVGTTENGKVTIRTLDLEGDKANADFKPKDIELTERRQMAAAIQTAEQYGRDRVGVMIPLISSAEHLRGYQEKMNAEAAKLGLAPIKLGAMVEVPSFVDDLANADPAFLSIGTNDLTSALLGFSRFGPDADRYDPTDPRVLAAIGKTVEAGRAKNCPVSVCGDMASDPRYVALVIGAGVRNLSAGPANIPLIKELVRRIDTNEARALYEKVSATPDRTERLHILDEFNRDRLGLENQNIMLTAPSVTIRSPQPPLPG